MKFTRALLSALCLTFALSALNLARAADTPPSDASIRELLQLMNVKKKNDEKVAAALRNVDQQFMISISSVGADFRKMDILDDVRQKVEALLRREMTWDKMEADYVAAYKNTSLTQHDVDAIVAFYKSEAGKHLTANLPGIARNMQMLTQARLRAIKPQVDKLKEAGMAKLRKIDNESD